ncbi:hypothetical protein BDW69DRAFT_164003 [Aspergillus filifer]
MGQRWLLVVVKISKCKEGQRFDPRNSRPRYESRYRDNDALCQTSPHGWVQYQWQVDGTYDIRTPNVQYGLLSPEIGGQTGENAVSHSSLFRGLCESSAMIRMFQRLYSRLEKVQGFDVGWNKFVFCFMNRGTRDMEVSRACQNRHSDIVLIDFD